jgi:hypothetical protein
MGIIYIKYTVVTGRSNPSCMDHTTLGSKGGLPMIDSAIVKHILGVVKRVSVRENMAN